MRFDEREAEVRKALEHGDTATAQVLAMLAVAERLDRLCALQSGGEKSPRW